MTSEQFAQRIKTKYPQYSDVESQKLVDAVLAKYPQYSASVSDRETTVERDEETGFLEKTQKVLGTVFGGEKIGEAIGAKIAQFDPRVQELQAQEEAGIAPKGSVEQTLEGPSGKEVAGDVLRTGALFTPIGKIAGAISRGAKALGAVGRTEKAAKLAGNVVGGGTAGAAADVGVGLAEGEDPRLGVGTFLGAGIPVASPVVKALGQVGRRATFETSGVLSGTSEETLEQAYQAAKAGGRQVEELTTTLRSRANPEKLVDDLRTSITTVRNEQQTAFRETLDALSDQVVETQPAKSSFVDTLNRFKVRVADNGTLDFSGSELRTVPAAQAKISQAWREIAGMPERMTLGELDTTRQAVKAIKSIAGDDPSASKANVLIEDATRSVRKAGEQVDGYGKMLDNFGESAEFLEELERGVSVGDRATVDQTYRRVITSLRTNNEQRQALLEELDAATGGALLSQISGQQLSEFLPRGIIGRFVAPFIAGGALTGGVTSAMIPGLLLASPRVTGEFARALGLTAAKTTALIEAIDTSRTLLQRVGAIGGAETSGGQ